MLYGKAEEESYKHLSLKIQSTEFSESHDKRPDKRLQVQIKSHSSYQDQESLNLNEKRQSTDVNTKMTHILELPAKYFKAAITTMFQKQLEAFRMLETKWGVGWGKQSINKETENVKNGHFGTAKYNNQNKNLTG